MRTAPKNKFLLLIAAAISSYLIYAPTNAGAQAGTVGLDATMGPSSLIDDTAALIYNDQRYSLAIRGSKLDAAAGTGTPFVGIVYNLRSPIDIVGTYVIASPGNAEAGDAETILLQTPSGVVLRFDIKQGDSESPFSLDGLTISMQ